MRRVVGGICIILVLLFIPLISANFFSDMWKKITGEAVKTVTVNISVGVPLITAVYNTSAKTVAVATGLNAGPNPTGVEINFTAYHGAGAMWLNWSTAKVNISMSGEVTRENATCMNIGQGASYSNFSCNITMWWYDGAGVWAIDASILDNNTNYAHNITSNITVGATTGFEMGPTNLTWSGVGAGATNKTSSNDPLIMNNTGNRAIGGFGSTAGTGNISINATHLYGEANPSYALYSGNFSVSYQTGGACTGAACVECAGDFMNKTSGNWANVTSANLTRGNFTVNNNNTGQEELFFCLKIAGSDLISQAYSTLNQGVWTIKI